MLSTSLEVVFDSLASALTVSEILTFGISDLEKVRQGHTVLLYEWRHFHWQISQYIKATWLFLALSISEIIAFEIVDLEEVDQDLTFTTEPFDGKYKSMYKSCRALLRLKLLS